MAAMQIFISHISEEREYAQRLKTIIQEDFLGLVEPFASSDIDGIEAGQRWLDAIKNAMKSATLVIVLCSRSSLTRPWVNFEVGAAWIQELPIVPLCHLGLTAKELPAPLSFYQAVEAAGIYGLERLYDSIAKAVDVRVPSPPQIHQRRREWAELEAMRPLPRVQQFERHIDITLPGTAQPGDEHIPEHARVQCGAGLLPLLGFINGDNLKWSEFVQAPYAKPDKRWLEELQKAVQLAANNKAFKRVQAVCHTDHGAFQPELARLDVDAEGNFRFHVHMVETVVAPLFEVPGDIGLLATMLRLGLRFRYEVIEKYRHMRPGKLPVCTLADLVTEVREAIEVIENDAQSRGAERLDEAVAVGLFAASHERDDMATVLDRWSAARARLFDDKAPLDMAALRAVLEEMRELNYRFMCLGTRRFHEMVRHCWRPEAGDRADAA